MSCRRVEFCLTRILRTFLFLSQNFEKLSEYDDPTCDQKKVSIIGKSLLKVGLAVDAKSESL